MSPGWTALCLAAAFLLFFAAAVGAEFRKVNFIAAGLAVWVLVSLYAAVVAL